MCRDAPKPVVRYIAANGCIVRIAADLLGESERPLRVMNRPSAPVGGTSAMRL
jgi:hypothetical protein